VVGARGLESGDSRTAALVNSVQTTLLGLAIAIILALVTAVVGPYFVDWGRYRAQFEADASRLTGLEVHVGGTIDARILPTPTLILQEVEFGHPGDAGKVRVRALQVEFAPAALISREWRAVEVRLQGAEFSFGLDGSGRLGWPIPAIGLDADAASIQALKVEDGRVVLTDAASGSRLVLDKLEFSGEVRSFAGPVKGQGSFTFSGQHYPYSVAVSRVGEDGVVGVRVNLDPSDRPLAFEADGMLWIEQGVPHFDGSLQLAHAFGRVSKGAQGTVEPWRVTGRFKGDSAAAVLEQIDFQYGPDDRAIKLRGDARLAFGARPRIEGVMSSRQIDLDRMLALPEAIRRRPLSAIKGVVDYFGDMRRLPIPVKLGISAETLTFAGATLQRVSGNLMSNAEALDIEALDFRAPGVSQIRLSGRLSSTPTGVAFAGPVKIDAGDPQKLVAWLTDHADAPVMAAGPLRVSGEIRLGSEMVAAERIVAEFDRNRLEGRLAYSWARGDRPSRLDAVLSAPDIDFDRTYALARSIAGDAAFEWPREGALALKIGRAIVAGVEAKNADVNMRLDADGLEIQRLALGDFGGAALAVTGRIDMRTPPARGAISLDLDARSLDGVVALLEKLSPEAASRLRRVAGRFVPAKLHGSLAVKPDAAAAPTKFEIAGSAGGFHVDVVGEGGIGGTGHTVADVAQLAAGEQISVTAHVDAGDGGVLVELLGLDRLVAVDTQPGRLRVAAAGPLDGDLAVDSRLTAGGLDVLANGTVRLSGQQGPSAGLALKIANAKVRTPRPAAAGRPADALPTALTARLTLAENTLGLSDLNGKVADSTIGGQLQIRLAEPMRIEGQIGLSALDLPEAIAAAVGAPPRAAGTAAGWSPEPFEAVILGDASGRISIKVARVSLTRGLAARDMQGVLNFGSSQLSIDDIEGSLAGGRLAGGLAFRRGADGMMAHGQVRLTGSDPAELIPGDGRPPLHGWVSLDLKVDASGHSPVALIGALHGGGTFTLQDGGIAGLDPTAFDAVTRAVDQGLPIEPTKIRDNIEPALANRGLAVPLAEGAITIVDGQLRVANTVVHTRGADLAISASVDLAESVMDARLKLSGPAAANATAGSRPELVIGLSGSIAAPKRTLDVAPLVSWLTLRMVEQQTKRLDGLKGNRDP
jgi:uncharacterized protein involved in outer membrane biogenesis